MTQQLRDWSILSLIGFVALFFLLEINVWSSEMQNDRLVIVIALACLVASEIIWEKQSVAIPLLLFFLYTAFMLLITLNGPSVVETIPYIRLLLPLSIPIAAYAVTPFEPTVQWGNLCIILFVLFGGYGFYQFQFAQSPVNGVGLVMFWLGYLFFFTLVVRSQPYMQPRMRPLLTAARYFAIGLIPIIVTQAIPIWWYGEPLIAGEIVYFCVIFIVLGFATLLSTDYSSFTNVVNKRTVALMTALLVYVFYGFSREYVSPFASDVLLIGLIVIGILRSDIWRQRITKNVFGHGELSADFMQSAANQLASPTYERIQQVTLAAANALNIAHVALIAENGQREWRTIASNGIAPTTDWVQHFHNIDEMRLFDGVHPSSGLPDWIRLVVPLHGTDAPQGHLILSSPRDTGQFHQQQLLQIETFSNLLLNAIQTASIKQQEAYFIEQTLYLIADTRQEIGTRIHAELLDRLRVLQYQLASQTGDPQRLVSEIKRSARAIMQDVYPINYSQDVESVVEATVKLCQSADVEIELNCANLADCQLSEHQRQVVSIVLQEGLTNALKHAQPTRIVATVAAALGQLTVSVKDNGLAPSTYQPSYGLNYVRYWIEAYGGHYTIARNPNGGTRFFCTMKYPTA